MRLVGAIPAIPERAQRRALGKDPARRVDWNGILIESVNATRTMLLHATRAESLQVVMVTSATGGEGKTSLAVHLAGSLARAGHKTLLVDGDLRNPCVDRILQVPPQPGFCDLLRGDSSVDEAIHGTSVPGLDVLPAGKCDTQAIQGLARNTAGVLFQALKQPYDFVIVDSSPVLPVADSLLLGQHVDAVVFSILRDVSRLPRVSAAYERLGMLGIRILGGGFAGVQHDFYEPKYQYTMEIPERA